MRDAGALPRPADGWALFLDVDGTLIEIADSPEAAAPAPGMRETLAALGGRFDGAGADLTRAVRETLGVRPSTAGLPPDRPVRTAAVLPGSGGAHLDDALSAGADVYVTGDLSHHEARRGIDGGMGLVGAGHGPTARPGVRALYAFAADITAEVVDLVGVDDTPWED